MPNKFFFLFFLSYFHFIKMDKTVWTYSIGDLSIEKRKNSSPLHIFTYRLPAEVSFLRYCFLTLFFLGLGFSFN